MIGCSQTRDAVAGYNAVSDADLFGPTEGFRYLSGGSIERWAEGDPRYWRGFESRTDPESDGLWVMLCWHRQRTPGDTDPAVVAGIIDRAFEVIGREVPVYVSGLNGWDPPRICPRGDYPRSWELAEATAAEGMALLGPDLGPLAESQTRDGCHGNDEGNRLMGEQVQAFFG